MRKALITVAVAFLLPWLIAGGYMLVHAVGGARQGVPASTVTLTAVPDEAANAIGPLFHPAQNPGASSPQTLLLKSSPTRLAVRQPVGGSGWEIGVADESAVRLHDNAAVGPTAIYWVGDQRALITWQWQQNWVDVLLFDLTSGELSTVWSAGMNTRSIPTDASVSPDGRLISLVFGAAGPDQETIIYDAATGEERFRTGPGEHRWIGPDLLWSGTQITEIGGPAAAATIPVSNPSDWAIALQNGSVCYHGWAGNGAVCVDPHKGTSTLLLDAGPQSPHGYAGTADPTGRYLFFAYQLRYQLVYPKWQCCKPQVPLRLVDAVVLYDSQSGQVKHLALPQAGEIRSEGWSPDGAYVGLAFKPYCKGRDLGWNCALEYWSLAVATNQLSRTSLMGADPGDVWRVQPDGTLLLRPTGGPGIVSLAYGSQPQPWQPDRKFFGFVRPVVPPASSSSLGARRDSVRHLTSTGDDRLTIDQPNGQACTFTWETGLPDYAYLSADSACQWAAVQQIQLGQAGKVTFVHR